MDETRSILSVMGRPGDTKVAWTATNRDEVDNARRTFEDLRKKGYIAWSVKRNGEKDAQITEFDPYAEHIIMSAPMRGGE